LALPLLAFLTFVAPAFAQDEEPAGATVTVRGDGVAQMKPAFARLVVSVSTTADTLQQASDQHRVRAARALALLQGMKAQGLEIQRSDFTLVESTPSLSTDRTSPTTQFTAQTDFTVQVDAIDKLDADIAALVDSGLVEIGSSTFEVTDPSAALNNARRAAIVTARRSAEAYADAGGFRLLDLEKVLDVTPQGFTGLASPMLERTAPESVALVPPARLSFRASVVATWRIGPR
jgi:uncharacterized protein